MNGKWFGKMFAGVLVLLVCTGISSAGTVLHYSFNDEIPGNDSDVITDSGPNGINGISAGLDGDYPTYETNGYRETVALNLQGNSGSGLGRDSVCIPYNAAMVPGMASFTWEIMIKAPTNLNFRNDYGYIVHFRGPDSSSSEIRMGMYGENADSSKVGKINFCVAQNYSDGLKYEADSPMALNDGQWHHLAIVRNIAANTVKFYVDYEEVASFADTMSLNISFFYEKDAIIGRYSSDARWGIEASVDEFRICDEALSVDQFIGYNDLYTILYYSFNDGVAENNSDVITDSGPYGIDGISIATDGDYPTYGAGGYNDSIALNLQGNPNSGLGRDAVKIPYNAALVPGTASFTWEIMIKAPTTLNFKNDFGYIVHFYGADSSRSEITMGMYGEMAEASKIGKIYFHVAANKTAKYIAESPTAMNDGQWHHLAIVRDAAANTIKYYLDYAEVASFTDTVVQNIGLFDNRDMIIGRYLPTDARWGIEASVDEFRISAKALDVRQFIGASSTTATPTFSLRSSYLGEAKNVVISCADVGATIRYTVDGSIPTEMNGNMITSGSAVLVDHTLTLKARAWASGKQASEVASATYIFPTNFNRPAQINQRTATIDGLLTEWTSGEWAPLDQPYDVTDNGADYLNLDIPEAYYAARWNADKLYVAVKVKDTSHYFTDEYTNYNARDAIEIHIHTTGIGINYSDIQQSSAQQYSVGIKNSNPNEVWTALSTLPIPPDTGFAAAGSLGDDGWIYYEVEMVPYEYFGGFTGQPSILSPLSLNDIIGLDVTVIGNSGGTYAGMKAENIMPGKWNDYTAFGLHKLVTASALHPGDANGDGRVDVGDLGILAANYGGSDKTWAQGDFNGDGRVDVGDLGILAAHYGEGVNGAADFSADYAKAFGTAAEEEVDGNSLCSGLGLPLIAGLLLAGLMLVKLED
jgi:hypothetical protein